MTWAEFKQAMEAAGVTDTDEISYIDVNTPIELKVNIVDLLDGRWVRVLSSP